jgi:hypothetical protein
MRKLRHEIIKKFEQEGYGNTKEDHNEIKELINPMKGNRKPGCVRTLRTKLTLDNIEEEQKKFMEA